MPFQLIDIFSLNAVGEDSGNSMTVRWQGLCQPYFMVELIMNLAKKQVILTLAKRIKKHRHKSVKKVLFFRIESVNLSVLTQQANTGLESCQRQ